MKLSSPDLRVTGLCVNYGHIAAVGGIDLEVPRGAIVAVLGANGAGKSSSLNAICGHGEGTVTGAVELFGESVLGRTPDRLVRAGMVLVPEGRQVFAPLTVEENLLMGAYANRDRKRRAELYAEVYALFPILHERRGSPAGVLSGGEQQMLAFGRALMADPKLILMDEPSMGLSPAMVDRVMSAVLDINDRGTSILLVEQNAAAALAIADQAYVLRQGRIVRQGNAEDVQADPAVAHAFLGLDEPASASSVTARP